MLNLNEYEYYFYCKLNNKYYLFILYIIKFQLRIFIGGYCVLIFFL